jgi:hypothetical protein
MKKNPQNIHSVIEFLNVDLEIWVNAMLIAGTKEEQKHGIFKSGHKAVNPVNPEKQLVIRDHIISLLR